MLFQISILVGRYENIFILNDLWSVEKLNQRMFVRKNCVYLPDPVWDASLYSGGSELIIEFPSDRKVLLFFGTIREDKGALLLLRALSCMSQESQKKLSVVFAGIVPIHERKVFLASYSDLSQSSPDLDLHFLDRHLNYKDASSLYQRADLISLLYIRSDRSSGVLNNSVLFGKVVIASPYGLIAEILSEYGLGILVKQLDPRSISESLTTWLEEYDETSTSLSAGRFIEGHRPEKYAATIFGAWGFRRDRLEG